MARYFNRSTIPIEIYRNLFKKEYVNKKISKYTLEGVVRNGKAKLFRIEDLAPIVYLHLKLHGHKENEKEYIPQKSI